MDSSQQWRPGLEKILQAYLQSSSSWGEIDSRTSTLVIIQKEKEIDSKLQHAYIQTFCNSYKYIFVLKFVFHLVKNM